MRKLNYFHGVILALLVAIVAVGWRFSAKDAAVVYDHEKFIRYSFAIKNQTDQQLKNGEFAVFAPVDSTPNQRVDKLQANLAYELHRDALGNQTLKFNLGAIAPRATKILTISALIATAGEPNATDNESVDRYLGDEPMLYLDHPAIQKQAKTWLDLPQDRRAAAIHQWVATHVQDIGYVSQDRGALYALQKKMGDCTEYMYLTVAMMRLNGIPARAMAGYVVENKTQKISSGEYHNWVEFYENGRWYISDPQKNVFMAKSAEYIAFRVIDAREKNALSTSQRFLAFDKNLSVAMN